MTDPAMLPAIKASIRANEIGSQSPYKLSFAKKGNSGASYGVFQNDTYANRTALTTLTQILTERRKELVHRGCRWTDLRRLNMDPRFATTLTRTLLGATYTLPPNDSRYTLQIPSYIITASNGSITQNP